MTSATLKEKDIRSKHGLANDDRERPYVHALCAIAGRSRRPAAIRRLAELRALYRIAREALADQAPRIRRLLCQGRDTPLRRVPCGGPGSHLPR